MPRIVVQAYRNRTKIKLSADHLQVCIGSQLFAHYDNLDEDLKVELPLKRIWMVAAQEEE